MKRFYFISLSVIILISLILTGCSSSSNTAPPSNIQKSPVYGTTYPASASTTLNNSEIPISTTISKYGGVLKWSRPGPASIFGDPILLVNAIDQTDAAPAYEFLIVANNDQAGAFSPELATSWELAPDKSYYIFRLRQNVKFHDGTDFNAAAVKWNLDRVVASSQPYLKNVKSIDVVDNYTIRINLSSWNSLFLNDLTQWACAMISPTAFQKNGDDWIKTNIVATGPFKQKEFKPKECLILERNTNYWKPGVPFLDRIEVYGVLDPMTYTLAFKAGEFNMIAAVDMITANQLRNEKYNVVLDGILFSQNLRFNSQDPTSPFSKKEVRQALEYALDKKTILDAVSFGFNQPIYGILGGVVEGGHPKTTPRLYNPDKAKQLLAVAGYGAGLKIKLLYQANEKDLPLAIQGSLNKSGFVVEMVPLETGAFYQKFISEACVGNEVLLAYGSWKTGNVIAQANQIFPQDPNQWLGVKRTEGTTDLMKQVLQEPDLAKAMAMLEKIEELAYDDAMFVPLCSLPFIWVFDNTVNGPLKRNFRTGPDWSQVWINK